MGYSLRKQNQITKLFALGIALFPMTACSQVPVKNEDRQLAISGSQELQCSISESDRESLLNLDYNSFDQSLPEGGWRKYQRCPLLTRELIDAYTAKHTDTLQKQQWDVLVWHSGQISGMAGDYADAIAKMEQTFKPNEKPTEAFLWNPYVRATIAFLKRDKPALIWQRKLLARGSSPFNHINLSRVDSFIRCFNSTYEIAYSGTCIPAETNIERIRSLAVPFDMNKPFSKEFFGISDFFAMKKVILVGEIHGTKTTPQLFGNIVEAVATEKSKTVVILEISQSSQSSIDEFLKTGDESILKKEPFFSRVLQDGRSSKAMVALLKKLAKLPNVKVLCMDPMIAGHERDTGMAAFINAKRVGYDHTIVLSGNLHSSTVIGTPWDKTYRPMGYQLKTLASDLGNDQLLNILVRYGKVDSWTCEGSDPCTSHYGKPVQSDYSEAVKFPSYLVWENQPIDGHTASIFIRAAKISFPFVKDFH